MVSTMEVVVMFVLTHKARSNASVEGDTHLRIMERNAQVRLHLSVNRESIGSLYRVIYKLIVKGKY